MKRKEVVCGGRVKWEYTRYYFQGVVGDCVKYGTLQKLVKHTHKYKGAQLAIIFFDGNQSLSRVPIHKLERV